MKLFIYAKKNSISARSLALKVGITPATMSKIMNGKASASLKTALKISKATNGEIDLMDLLEEADRKDVENFLQ